MYAPKLQGKEDKQASAKGQMWKNNAFEQSLVYDNAEEVLKDAQRYQQAGLTSRVTEVDPDWIPDEYYYHTKEEAERRMANLKEAGEWDSYRVVLHSYSNGDFWRVEMKKGVTEESNSETPEDGIYIFQESDTTAYGVWVKLKSEGKTTMNWSEFVELNGGEERLNNMKSGETLKYKNGVKDIKTKTEDTQAGKNVFLTFDDGPNKGTEPVLDNITPHKATFYLTGKNMAYNTTKQFQIVKRIIDEGHAIGNHSYTHIPMTKTQYNNTSKEDVVKDFEKNESHFTKIFENQQQSFPGFPSLRLPGDGRTFPDLVKKMEESFKVPHYGWNFEFAPNGLMGHVANKNWQGIAGLAATYERMPKDGDIILLHDGHWVGKADILKKLVEKLKNQGYKMKKI